MATTLPMPARSDHARSPAPAYRAIWRWHLYAGLFVAPVLILLAITGALYLFDREIEGWWNADVQTVTPGAARQPLADQEAAVRAAWPGAVVQRVRLPRLADEASLWQVRLPGGTDRDIYVDPYRAHVTGERDPALQPMAIVRRIHASLLAGEAGRYVVELAACWTLVMLVTGILLWWPKRWRARGVIVPRLRGGERRRWRDLHAIPSALNVLLVAGLILTGLPWSVFWGVQFARLGESVPFIAPTPNFSAHMPATAGPAPGGAHHHSAPAATLPWVIRQQAVPHASGPRRVGIAAVEPLLARLDRAQFGEGVRIIYPQAPGEPFTISYVPDRAEGQRTLYVDPVDGRVIDDIGWARYSPVGRIVEWGTMTHMGRQYGWPNQLANLIVCAGLIGSVVAGLTLWWRRRPGSAPMGSSERLPAPLVALLAALGIAFPLVGASLIVLLVLGVARQAMRARLDGVDREQRGAFCG